MVKLSCSHCARQYPEEAARWICHCGWTLDWKAPATFPRASITARPPSLWRYREALPLSPGTEPVSLGEPLTPLIQFDPAFPRFFLKLEFLFPTGSFKDRGSALLISKARELGVSSVVEDSSGNAGASIAAYCARAGMECQIFVPARTSEAKLTQIRAVGGRLIKVEGTREQTGEAALEAARGTYYASHSWNPYFLQGTKTFAFEVWEQLGWKAPDWLILPVGNGTLLLGAYTGFRQLWEAGEIDRIPRIIGVQSEGCPPLALAHRKGLSHPASITKTETLAEGISVARPIRGRQILEAVSHSQGFFLTVTDQEILASLRAMARAGLYLEPTAAAATAAWEKVKDDSTLAGRTIVVPLTGSGLKAGDSLAKLF